jgi:uncharacterized protein involved in oxidation of intracellular sulfur
MAKLLITGTHGTDDPTRASLPFHLAKGAKEAGYDVDINLAIDAPLIMKDYVRGAIQGVGMPPLAELFQFAVDNKIHVYV